MSSGRSSSSQGKPQFCFFLLAADGMRLLRMIHFLVLSQDFHLFADIALLLLMLATLSIRALSILIVVVLNSQSDNSRIYAISGCDECFISSSCLFFFENSNFGEQLLVTFESMMLLLICNIAAGLFVFFCLLTILTCSIRIIFFLEPCVFPGF